MRNGYNFWLSDLSFLWPKVNHQTLVNDVYLKKHHGVSFQKNLKWREHKLDLVHSNVCDPIKVEFLGDNKYFVTFIDNTTRETWVYLL